MKKAIKLILCKIACRNDAIVGALLASNRLVGMVGFEDGNAV
jgi:hypothetical protein